MSKYEDLTILVVDDDINIRSFAMATLDQLGVGRILMAGTVDDAIHIANMHQLDGAFVDLVLQSGSGLEVGRKMARDGTPVVFCSAVRDDFNISQMLEIGWIIPKQVLIQGLIRGLEWFRSVKRCCELECEDRK